VIRHIHRILEPLLFLVLLPAGAFFADITSSLFHNAYAGIHYRFKPLFYAFSDDVRFCKCRLRRYVALELGK